MAMYQTVLEMFSELFAAPTACQSSVPAGTWNKSANAAPEHEYNTWLRMKHGGTRSIHLEGANHWTDSALSMQSTDSKALNSADHGVNSTLSTQSSDGAMSSVASSQSSNEALSSIAAFDLQNSTQRTADTGKAWNSIYHCGGSMLENDGTFY
eukprot:gnl/MRDRNA2_/MRDRNA2_60712_c0_seq1.p1 gnl/MRDRNA2_/MRDRNA2_60712_c0~~gnl/MRDRNA2_/MRDRNA2_60712_c0_seq1.p1  ORF type:complete len:153 (+),score=24.98 gnl/MRDRNA2_/MRDRNA2_60712_c0_seq1:78-536(+)